MWPWNLLALTASTGAPANWRGPPALPCLEASDREKQKPARALWTSDARAVSFLSHLSQAFFFQTRLNPESL